VIIVKTDIKPDTTPRPRLVVTDLDGTLLDHHDYSFRAALPALKLLAAHQIPVVYCSSKTRAEILALKRATANTAPFIVENGAAICPHPDDTGRGGLLAGDLVLGMSHHRILAVLAGLRSQFCFRGFSDMSAAEVAERTGLAPDAAALAREREFSEPLVWQGRDDQRADFILALAEAGCSAQQGGRFLTVSGRSDKGRAVTELRGLYASHWGAAPEIIALGDSPNDVTMLAAADIAVIVRSDNSPQLQVSGPKHILRTQLRGPAGWASAITTLMEG